MCCYITLLSMPMYTNMYFDTVNKVNLNLFVVWPRRLE